MKRNMCVDATIFVVILDPCALLLFKVSSIPRVTVHGDVPCVFAYAKK